MLAVKILGLVDILTAVVIFMNINLLFLTIPIFLVHFVKGITSMAADPLGKLYGSVDLISSFVVLLHIVLPEILSSFLIIILLFKGVTSLL
ncbi:MAG TPA: hypothetical protein VJB05_03280 [archaeon]|nr:hypothetical protein [archaeon]